MKTVKPKKFLGQHFLKDLKIAQDIADTVDACPGIPVLEVGPGMGVMTQFLVGKGRPVKVVEIDFESVAYLRANYPQLEENIIEDDFLKMHLERTFGGQPFVLTGNYPYNISSQILQDARLQRPHPLLYGHDTERGGGTHCRRSGQQDLRYPERTHPGMVQRGILVHGA